MPHRCCEIIVAVNLCTRTTHSESLGLVGADAAARTKKGLALPQTGGTT